MRAARFILYSDECPHQPLFKPIVPQSRRRAESAPWPHEIPCNPFGTSPGVTSYREHTHTHKSQVGFQKP